MYPIVNYKEIEGETLLFTSTNLSNDQQYLLNIYNSVRTGLCPGDLALHNPGNLFHARWTTTANRILRQYVSSNEPSNTLEILTNYIMKVYAPVWFSIKHEPAC